MPAFLAAVPLLGKAIAFGKGLTGLGAVKGGASTLGAFGKGAAVKRMAGEKLGSLFAAKAQGAATAAKPVSSNMAANIKYVKDNYGIDLGGTVKDVMTRDKMKGLNMADDAGFFDRIKRGTTSLEGFKKNLGHPMNREELMMTVAPDLLFGGLSAVTTEGDILDKAIAGVGSAAGGIGGGLGARGVLGPKSNLGILSAEMMGGIGGDMVGMNMADSLIRLKNGGATPAEQSYTSQQQLLYDQFLREQGLG